jgi:CRISPR-associated endonuclease Csn1
MARFEKDDGFLARQLTDTQYLSRLAGKYLSSLYPTKEDGSVYVIPGRMTAMLRRKWGLNSLLPDHNYVENEHSNAPKNRLDHRHHAIDAAVVAVTTRATLQKIARAAGEAEDRDLDRLTVDVEQPWDGFREELGEKLLRVTASHKADHGRKGRPSRHHDVTAGRLHNDTAYGLTDDVAADGKTPIVVHRVPLASLKPGDLTNPDRIPDRTLRDELYRVTRDLSGSAFVQVLEDIRKNGLRDRNDKNGRPLFRGLRHVRLREPLNVIPIHDASGHAYKAYKGDANDRMELWRLPDGRLVTLVISSFAAHQKEERERPHPAAKRLLKLRKNDLLAVERNGGTREILRVAGFNQAGRLTLAPANEGGKLDERDRTENDRDPFKYVYLSGRSIVKAKARQVRVDPLGRLFDPGPRP